MHQPNTNISSEILLLSPPIIALLFVVCVMFGIKYIKQHLEMPAETAGYFARFRKIINPLLNAPSLRNQFIVYAAICICLTLAAGLDLYFNRTPRYPLDDPYITLHNAQVMHWGHDPNYPGVPALAGTTSAFHNAIVYLFLAFLSPLGALQAALWLGVIAYATGILALAFAYRASILQSLLLLAVGLAMGHAVHQLLNGLETGLSMAAVVWTFALIEMKQPIAKRTLFLLCGILPAVRPELALLSIITVLFQLAPDIRNLLTTMFRVLKIPVRKQQAFCERESIHSHPYHTSLLNLGTALVCILIGALPWMLWYKWSLGVPYPTTIMAKSIFFRFAPRPWTSLAGTTLTHVFEMCLDLGVLAAMFFVLPLSKTGRIAAVFCVSFIALYGSRAPDVLGWNEQRYLYPIFVISLVGCMAAWKHRNSSVRKFTSVILLSSLLYALFLLPAKWRIHQEQCAVCFAELSETAKWCEANVPQNEPIIIHDAGYIAYSTQFRLIDMVGLKTPLCSKYISSEPAQDMTVRSARALTRIAADYHARYFVVDRDWDNPHGISGELNRMGCRLELLHRSMRYCIFEIKSLERSPAAKQMKDDPAKVKIKEG